MNRLKLGESALRGGARRQPSNEVAFAPPVPGPFRMYGHDRDPRPFRSEQIERLGHHSDHLERGSAPEEERDRLSHDRGVRAKELAPRPVAQYESGYRRYPVVLGTKGPAYLRRSPEDLEEVPGHGRNGEARQITRAEEQAVASPLRPESGHGFELTTPPAPLQVLGVMERVVLHGALDVHLRDENEAFLCRHRKGAEQQSVDDREDGSGSADSKRENDDWTRR